MEYIEQIRTQSRDMKQYRKQDDLKLNLKNAKEILGGTRGEPLNSGVQVLRSEN